jgi:hypothetical protein
MADFPTLASIINAHHWRGTTLGCACHEWNWTEPLTHFCGEEERIERAHAEHVAAEWVKARTIETVEQLDALPDHSIIRCAGGAAWHKQELYSQGEPWWCAGSEIESPPTAVQLPARLLYDPEVDS